ncbi:MAG TPA: peptidase [Firmicutes bacterium]|nr:peptidase [Bacillota bacterium]
MFLFGYYSPYGMYGYSSNYFIYLLLVMLIPLIVQGKLTSTMNKYLRVRSSSGLTGSEVARKILDMNGLRDVHVTQVSGRLSDHYDPTRRVVRLSDDIYRGTSIASVAVAAHECGHALQHAQGYAALKFRSAMFPVVNIANKFGYVAIILGFIFSSTLGNNFLLLGIGLVAVTVLFQVVTLPVEYNASSRAIKQLESIHVLHGNEEVAGAKKVLSAAALTYVAGAVVAILELLRLVAIFNSRND